MPAWRPLTRFDLHVLGRFLSALALLVALLGLTFVTFDYAERVDDFLDRGATTAQVFGTYYRFYLFDIVRLTLPLAAFLASIYVTARLSQSMQLTALRASGVSLGRFLRPFVLAGLVLTGGMLAFTGWAVPRAMRIVHAFQNQYFADAPESAADGEITRQMAADAVLSVGFYERDAQRAYRVSLVRLDTTGGADGAGRGVASRLDAAEMTYSDSLATWTLRDATRRDFSDGAERFSRAVALDTALAVTPADLAQSERDAERMTLPEKSAFLSALDRAGVVDQGRARVAYYGTFAYPVSTLILILLGVPLASRRRRGGQAVALALGLGVAFLYFALQRTLEPLGYVGGLPPLVAVWAPHVLFAVVAAVALWRARRGA